MVNQQAKKFCESLIGLFCSYYFIIKNINWKKCLYLHFGLNESQLLTKINNTKNAALDQMKVSHSTVIKIYRNKFLYIIKYLPEINLNFH